MIANINDRKCTLANCFSNLITVQSATATDLGALLKHNLRALTSCVRVFLICLIHSILGPIHALGRLHIVRVKTSRHLRSSQSIEVK